MRIDLENYQDIEIDKSFDYGSGRKKRRPKNNLTRILIAVVITSLIICLVGYLILKFFIGPIIKTVDGLPGDFPTDLVFYQADQAKINLEDQAGKEKVVAGLKAMPDWVLTLFLNFLSEDLKKQLADNFGENINIPKNFSVDDLKEALDEIDVNKTQTVNLSWDGVDKTKEEVAAYYKKILQDNHFEFKENLTDYQINLGFWRDNVFGLMSFSDKKEEITGGVKYNSDVDITVNYLNELQK